MLPFPHFLVNAIPSFTQAHNSTLLSCMRPTELDAPFYYTARPHLSSWITDRHLSLLAPIAIYWVLSTVFHILDTLELPYFERHRIHESATVKSRNRATFWQVIWAVIAQQIVQTIVGLMLIDSDEVIMRDEVLADHVAAMGRIAPRVADVVMLAVGPATGARFLEKHGQQVVNFAYWWAIPAIQLFAGL